MTQEEKKIIAAEVTMKVYRRLTDNQYIVDLGGYPCLGVEIHCDVLQDILCEIVREYDDGEGNSYGK